ncbi:DUF3788 family protein [Massilimicrobiota timonensis]|uniref:Uncharacterized protein n=1 Tax=Massilimicrobiota timonensis TaxID=1776392 RepID=A0A1Y4SI64_9FIRM|nr:DUF3788 family protein [Massilimicrobiota timonensis]OUQ29577.1 hypothetical protein B5E75_14160 [Massilimicrobiota timonensis]
MLDKIPNAEEMTNLVGQSLYDVWNKLCALIDEKYEMERLCINATINMYKNDHIKMYKINST